MTCACGSGQGYEACCGRDPAHLQRVREGAALHQQGRLQEALSIYWQVLRQAPGHIDANQLLAVALHQGGRHAEAEGPLRAALALRPHHPVFHLNLSEILRALGRGDEAEAHLRQALALKPDYADAHYNLGNLLRERERHEEALRHYQQAVALAPEQANHWNNMGLQLLHLKRYGEALDTFQQAVAVQPGHVEALYNLATVQFMLGETESAWAVVKRCVAQAPGLAKAHQLYSQIGMMFGEYGQAVTALKRAVQLAPDDLDLLLQLAVFPLPGADLDQMLALLAELRQRHAEPARVLLAQAMLLEKKGEVAQARELVLPLLGQAPHAVMIMARMCQDAGERRQCIEILEGLLAGVGDGPRVTMSSRMAIHFLLGDLYDKLGEYDSAFNSYSVANSLKPAHYDDADMTARLREGLDFLSQGQWSALPRLAVDAPLPVFIIGMPRSGTSLAEQILASHPLVHGAGELGDISRMATAVIRHTGLPYPQCLARVDAGSLAQLAASHRQLLRQLAGPGPLLVTDKMPNNFNYLPLIRLLYPEAPVIHCQRDPRDTCLSMYFQNFAGNHPFCYDLGHLGRYYGHYLRLMDHWRRLGISFLDLPYEELLEEPEEWVARILHYVGLPWDDRCLAFHESKRVVRTASYQQVRKPLYKSSRGRWQRYASHLGPLLIALREAGAIPP